MLYSCVIPFAHLKRGLNVAVGDNLLLDWRIMMEMIITTETKTISGKTYAIVVPKDLLGSFKQGIFIESILPECIIYNLPLSDPKAAAERLARLAQMHDNAEIIDVPAAVREFIEEAQTSFPAPLPLKVCK